MPPVVSWTRHRRAAHPLSRTLPPRPKPISDTLLQGCPSLEGVRSSRTCIQRSQWRKLLDPPLQQIEIPLIQGEAA